MASILTIAPPDSDFHEIAFQWVIAAAELAGVEEHAQDLHVVLGRNAGDDDSHEEQADSAE
jgi:hypothetical protein